MYIDGNSKSKGIPMTRQQQKQFIKQVQARRQREREVEGK